MFETVQNPHPMSMGTIDCNVKGEDDVEIAPGIDDDDDMTQKITKTFLARAGRVTCRGVPLRTLRNVPIPVANMIPVRLRDDLLLGLDERVHRTHAILLDRASGDARERNNAIVDDDTDLWPRFRLAGQHCLR
jgi:hypothetical protein